MSGGPKTIDSPRSELASAKTVDIDNKKNRDLKSEKVGQVTKQAAGHSKGRQNRTKIGSHKEAMVDDSLPRYVGDSISAASNVVKVFRAGLETAEIAISGELGRYYKGPRRPQDWVITKAVDDHEYVVAARVPDSSADGVFTWKLWDCEDKSRRNRVVIVADTSGEVVRKYLSSSTCGVIDHPGVCRDRLFGLIDGANVVSERIQENVRSDNNTIISRTTYRMESTNGVELFRAVLPGVHSPLGCRPDNEVCVFRGGDSVFGDDNEDTTSRVTAVKNGGKTVFDQIIKDHESVFSGPLYANGGVGHIGIVKLLKRNPNKGNISRNAVVQIFSLSSEKTRTVLFKDVLNVGCGFELPDTIRCNIHRATNDINGQNWTADIAQVPHELEVGGDQP